MNGMANDDVVVSMADTGDANRNVRISLRGAAGPEINLSVHQARALAMELLDIVQANGGSPAEDAVSSGKNALAETDLRSVPLKKVIFALPSLTAAAIGWKIKRFRQYSRVRYNAYRRPIVEIAGIKIPIGKHLSDNLRDAILIVSPCSRYILGHPSPKMTVLGDKYASGGPRSSCVRNGALLRSAPLLPQ